MASPMLNTNLVEMVQLVFPDTNGNIVQVSAQNPLPTTGGGGGGGSGTVTSVSVATANGVSGSVANPTTTPSITITLGAITPTSVNGLTLAAQSNGFTIAGGTTPATLTVAANASVSGTNTGDQSGANPSAQVGLTAINGSSTSFMRADAAPAINQAITPTWSGTHIFNAVAAIQVASTSTTGVQIFNTVDQVTNYEALAMRWVSNTFQMLMTTGGTGTARNIQIMNGGTSLIIKSGAQTTGSFQLGATSGGTVGAIGYNFSGWGSSAVSGTSVALSLTPTYNEVSGTAANTDLLVNRTETAVGSGLQLFIDAQVAGSSRFSVDNNGAIASSGFVRVATQFDVAASTTLANITGLSVNVKAGGTYVFEAILHVNADATGGHKYAIGGTATATSIIYEILAINNTLNSNVITARQTALASSAGQAGSTSTFTRIVGLITVNAAGTLTVQFAQNAASGTSSVLVGSSFRVFRS
jgi:hypothetical protein